MIKQNMIWKHKDGELSLQEPLIMGILNVTPDSFFDGGRYNSLKSAVDRAYQMVEQGAHILDIGGESTRPGSKKVNTEEELNRVLPVVEALAGKIGVPMSIDSQKVEVARTALEKGASIVNDVGGLRKQAMAQLVAETGAGVVIMHMKGIPETMQDGPYYQDVVGEITAFFQDQVRHARQHTIEAEQIVLDPGIGFGKRLKDNLTILRSIPKFKALGYPLLIGASQKSMIQALVGPQSSRLVGSVVVHSYSILQGGNIVRVHDVQETAEALAVLNAMTLGEK